MRPTSKGSIKDQSTAFVFPVYKKTLNSIHNKELLIIFGLRNIFVNNFKFPNDLSIKSHAVILSVNKNQCVNNDKQQREWLLHV